MGWRPRTPSSPSPDGVVSSRLPRNRVARRSSAPEHVGQLLERDQHLARLAALVRADDAQRLERVHQLAGAGVTDLQTPLETTDARLILIDHELGGRTQLLVLPI